MQANLLGKWQRDVRTLADLAFKTKFTNNKVEVTILTLLFFSTRSLMLTSATLLPTLTQLVQCQRECFREKWKRDGTCANFASTWEFSVVSTCPPLPLKSVQGQGSSSGSVTEDGLINYAYAKPECECLCLSVDAGVLWIECQEPRSSFSLSSPKL